MRKFASVPPEFACRARGLPSLGHGFIVDQADEGAALVTPTSYSSARRAYADPAMRAMCEHGRVRSGSHWRRGRVPLSWSGALNFAGSSSGRRAALRI